MDHLYMVMTAEQTRQYYADQKPQFEKMIWELANTAQQLANDQKKAVIIYTCAIAVTEIQPVPPIPSNPATPPDTTT